jgi:eukaryotic-like serine/threonine-protein kinase
MKQPVPFGKYTLLERISVGGMAEVFRAKTFGVEGFERLVAVKRILPNIAEDKEFIRMFVEEAKLAVQLNHANIAQITDLGVVDGSYYITIEHVHGRDLKSVFERMHARNEVMPASHACFIAMKVCEGLDYAHNKRDQSGGELGLVHRDVSPQNVIVSFEGEIKLIDFGIAKAVGTTITTQSGVLKGKLGYMSPEQVRGLPVDRRADVFACGIVLYEMLTGERLFVGESDFSTLEKVRNVDIPPPTMHNSKIPEELERIVLKALAREASARYQHAIDLHDDLQAFVYTAGEFCSRKDMAAWMKKAFAKEIDEETAKLEAFRQLHPAPGSAPAMAVAVASPGASAGVGVAPAARHAGGTKPIEDGRRTKAMGSPASRPPPPPPPGRSQQLSALEEPSSATSSAKLLALTPPGALPALPAAAPRPGRPMPTPSGNMFAPAPTPAPLSAVAAAASLGNRDKSGVSNLMRPSAGLPAVSGGIGTDTGPAATVSDSMAASGDFADDGKTRADVPSELTAAVAGTGPQDDDDLSDWDDEEEDLETQIYDNDFDSAPVPKTDARSPGRPRTAVAPAPQAPAAARPATRPAEPSRVGLPPASRQVAAADAAALRPGTDHREGREVSRVAPAPTRAATETRETREAREAREVSRVLAAPVAAPPKAAPSVAIPQLPPRQTAEPREIDPMLAAPSQFGRGVLAQRPSRRISMLWWVAGGAALVIGAVALAFTVNPGGGRGGGAAAVAGADDQTGFDLYVVPAGITRWRLDGELRTDRLPSRIRGIAPGPHAVVIEAPPGFMSQSQNVVVTAGQAQKVTIELPVMEITGLFRSDPEGASITIIADGERRALGVTPVTYKLDPRKSYQVLIEKAGFVSANQPVTLSGGERETFTIVLEKADGGAPAPPPPGGHSGSPGTGQPAPATRPPASAPAPRPTPARPAATAPARPAPARPTPEPTPATTAPAVDPGLDVSEGTLQVSAKPPCEISVDGKATGLSTPQREIILSVGSHRITLSNKEFGIDETFTVDIKPGAPSKLVKDFSDRLPQ